MAETRRFLVMLSPDLIALEACATAKTQFLSVPLSSSSAEMIGTACLQWQIDQEDHTNYCLIFDDTKKYLSDGT